MSNIFKDNSAEVINDMNSRINRALYVIGLAVIEIASDYILTKYYQPAYDTGTLLRSLTFNIDMSKKTVTIGSNVEYAPWVHNGTRRMPARPFLRDAVMNNISVYQQIAEQYLGAGWKINAKMGE